MPDNKAKPDICDVARIKMKKVAYDIARPFFHLFHHIFTDKLYSAIDLATWLLAKRTYFTGAIKMNSQKLPIDLRELLEMNLDGTMSV